MKRKKLLAMALVASLGAMLLAGCGDDSGSGSGSSGISSGGGSDGDGQVTIYVTDWENDQMNEAIQKACDEIFTAEHPNIKVEVLSGSYSDYGQQITAMLEAGDNLDIFQQGYDGGATRFGLGELLDIGDRLKDDQDFVKGFYPGAIEGWTTGDSVYGLPGLANVYGVFYNKELLAEKGLKEPTTDWTWDDLFELAEACKDTASTTYGIYGFNTEIFGTSVYAISEGAAPFLDKPVDPSGVTVDDTMVKCIEKISSLVADGTLPPRTYEASDVQSQFEAGTIPLLWYGQWEINSLIQNDPGFEWGFAPTPKGSKSSAVSYDYVGWCVKKECEHPDEAYEVLKFLSSDCYKEVLKVTPVAACAHESSATVFFDTVTEAGHKEAADAVETMMAADTKAAMRFGGAWSDDAGKVLDITYNELVDNGSDDFNTPLQEACDQINAIIAAE